MKIPGIRRRHSVHPFLDYCAACGMTPVLPGSDCDEQMDDDRRAELVVFLAHHGYELEGDAHPGYIRKKARDDLHKGARVEYDDANGKLTKGMVDEVDPATGRVYVLLAGYPGRESRVWFDAHELDRLRPIGASS